MGLRRDLEDLADQMPARAMLRLSATGLALELGIAATTILPGAPVVPQWPQFVLFLGLFPIGLRSVFVMSRPPKVPPRDRYRDLLRRVPLPLAAGFIVFSVLAMPVALSSITHIRGQPTRDHGRYFLGDHGRNIPVSRSQYRHALVLQQRIFTLIPSVFYAFGLLVNVAYPDASRQLIEPSKRPTP